MEDIQPLQLEEDKDYSTTLYRIEKGKYLDILAKKKFIANNSFTPRPSYYFALLKMC